VTGLFFDEQTSDSLVQAMDKFENIQEEFHDRDAFNNQVKKFSRDEFKKRIQRLVAEKKKI
jgi:preprotein translocase subunit Sss1